MNETLTLTLQRLHSYNDYSIGLMYVDGKLHSFTLEDEKRSVKVWGDTRIPAGVYNITYRTAGRLHRQYSQQFYNHKGMLWIRNIPNFEYVYIHIGNDDDDTAGCILVGQSHQIGQNFIAHSTKAYESLYHIVSAALNQGKQVRINVVDEVLGV